MANEAHLGAWRAHKQGLDGSGGAAWAGLTPREVVERAGWMRSVGGSSPYLGIVARAALGREAVDAALAAVEIHELPAARGCTYVVPAREYALALSAGLPFAGDEMKVARKLGGERCRDRGFAQGGGRRIKVRRTSARWIEREAG